MRVFASRLPPLRSEMLIIASFKAKCFHYVAANAGCVEIYTLQWHFEYTLLHSLYRIFTSYDAHTDVCESLLVWL